MISNRKFMIGIAASALLGGGVAMGGYKLFFSEPYYQTMEQKQQYWLSNYNSDTGSFIVPEGMNFIHAADQVRPAVVHIKTFYEAKSTVNGRNTPLNDPFLRQFFGDDFPQQQQGPQEASGSGVILSEDGYIVTNNHVIENADKIKVVLDDKRSFEAKLIGKDPTTDLAVLKIEEKGLAFVQYGNSDAVRVGEWVLAVGNPFDLTSTVTAGIVSAKARNINILRSKERMAIESFIQTDAAVNPGNSGGALVNLKGELVGINSAIATPTGSYAGYSFAVPVNIVKKVVNDLMQYGEVQRALLGVNIQDVTAELAKEKGLKEIKGVYIAGINEGSAAKDGGLQEGDVIFSINDQPTNTSAELQENIGRHHPGDKVKVVYFHKGDIKTTTITLKNKNGNTNIVKSGDSVKEVLGASLTPATSSEKQKLKINSGVKISKLGSGKLKEAGIKEGFIITQIDKYPVNTQEEILSVIEKAKGSGVLIEGIYPNGQKAYYATGF